MCIIFLFKSNINAIFKILYKYLINLKFVKFTYFTNTYTLLILVIAVIISDESF